MLEQQLINAFMKFTAKAGAGKFIKDLVREIDENGNPKSWTIREMENAIHFLHQRTEGFGKGEAILVVKTLLKKFDIDLSSLPQENDPSDERTGEFSGIQGLQ